MRMNEFYRVFNGNYIIIPFLFIISIKAAKVVDFPLPVGPVTNTNPLSFSVKSEIIEGNPSSERV